MKLLTKYSRTNFIASVIVLLLASSAYYFFLHFFLLQQMDEELETEQVELVQYARDNHQLPKIVELDDEVTTYKKVNAKDSTTYSTSEKTVDFDTNDFRFIKFYVTTQDGTYEVAVGKSLENTERIIRLVIMITVITIIVLLLTSFLLNRIVLSRLWKPFYRSIEKIKQYRLGQKDFNGFEKTNIDEFQMLNQTLEESIQRNDKDYNTLKAFTENASHEMQTPVAIIHSKMDSLIQDVNLSAAQSKIVQEAYTALQRLTRLNKTLLLLTKIENRQYSNFERIDLKKVLEEKMLHFQDLVEKKNIKFELEEIFPTAPVMNAGLADILVNNLLSNCIKYTLAGGSILIRLFNNGVDFCNGPATSALEPGLIFDRFYKSGDLPDQHGLGLAIVKEICTASNFKITYLLEAGQHVFRIEF